MARCGNSLAGSDGLIGDGLQFTEPRMRQEILLGKARASPSGRSHSSPMVHGAPRGLQTFAQFPTCASDASLEAFTFGPGWLHPGSAHGEKAARRAIASPCVVGLAVLPAASRHLLSVTLVPVQHHTPLPGGRRSEVRILADGREIGTAVLETRWQQDGARYAFWLPPGQVEARPLTLEFHHADGFELAGLTLAIGMPMQETARTPADLMLLFENIGDNCEFGLVQRHFQAEPVGLLRFAGLGDMYRLVRLLDDRFGTPGERGSLGTIVVGGEYWIQDRTYGIAYHTFRYQHDSDAADVLRDNEVKTRYLKRKLCEDLEDGEKIFVYKRAVTQDPHEVLALHAALNRFGKVNKLFWVTPADDEHQAGEVEWVSDRLLRGRLRTISLSDAHDYDAELWLRLCRSAVAAFDAAGG